MSALAPSRPLPPSQCWMCRTPLAFLRDSVRWIAGLGIECAPCSDRIEQPLEPHELAEYARFVIEAQRSRRIDAMARAIEPR